MREKMWFTDFVSTMSIYSMLTLILALYSYSEAYAESGNNTQLNSSGVTNINSQSTVPVEDKWSRYLLIFTALTVAVTVITFLILYGRDKHKDSLESMIARELILNELLENKKALLTDVHERIKYATSDANNIREVNFINAYLEVDAYQSIINSGYLKHLDPFTQIRLNMLYGRINSRNELINYLDRFEDLFFVNDDSDGRKTHFYKKVEKYDLLLTIWENDIIALLEEIERKVKEKPTKSSRLYNISLKLKR